MFQANIAPILVGSSERHEFVIYTSLELPSNEPNVRDIVLCVKASGLIIGVR